MYVPDLLTVGLEIASKFKPLQPLLQRIRGFVGVSVVEVRHLKHFHRSVFEYSNKRDSQPIITTPMQNYNGQGDVGL